VASAENSPSFREGHCPMTLPGGARCKDHRCAAQGATALWLKLSKSSDAADTTARCLGMSRGKKKIKTKTCKDTFGDISLQFVHVCTMYKYVPFPSFSCQDIPARFFLPGDKRGISTKVLGEDAWQTLRDDPSTSNKTCSSLKGKREWFHFHEWQCRIVATSVASQTHVWPRVQKCAFDQLDATSKQLQIRRLFGIMYL